MKQLLALLLFPLLAIAQNDSLQPQNTSVVSAEKLNIVYRGVANPIKIAFPGAISFTASATGLVEDKTKGKGNYIVYPQSGSEMIITIKAVMKNGKVKIEKKLFRIFSLPSLTTFLLGSYNYSMTKDALINTMVDAKFEDFLFPEGMTYVKEFTISILNRSGTYKVMKITGNKLTDDVKKEINRTKNGDIITINNIKIQFSINDMSVCKIPVIGIKITE